MSTPTNHPVSVDQRAQVRSSQISDLLATADNYGTFFDKVYAPRLSKLHPDNLNKIRTALIFWLKETESKNLRSIRQVVIQALLRYGTFFEILSYNITNAPILFEMVKPHLSSFKHQIQNPKIRNDPLLSDQNLSRSIIAVARQLTKKLKNIHDLGFKNINIEEIITNFNTRIRNPMIKKFTSAADQLQADNEKIFQRMKRAKTSTLSNYLQNQIRRNNADFHEFHIAKAKHNHRYLSTLINTIKNLSDYGSFESYITSLAPRQKDLKVEILEEIKTYPRTTRGKGRKFGYSKEFPSLPPLKGGSLECHPVNKRDSGAAKRIAKKTKQQSVKETGSQGKTKVYKCDCCPNLIPFDSNQHKSIGWCRHSSHYEPEEFLDDDEISIVSLSLSASSSKQCFQALKGGSERTTTNKCAVDALNSYFKYHNKKLLDPLTIKHRDTTVNEQLDSNELVSDKFFDDPEVTQGYSVILFDHNDRQIRFFDHLQNKYIFVGFKNHHYYLENIIPIGYSLVSYNDNIINNKVRIKRAFKQMYKAGVLISSVLAFFNNQLVHVHSRDIGTDQLSLEVIAADEENDLTLTQEIQNVIPNINLAEPISDTDTNNSDDSRPSNLEEDVETDSQSIESSVSTTNEFESNHVNHPQNQDEIELAIATSTNDFVTAVEKFKNKVYEGVTLSQAETDYYQELYNSDQRKRFAAQVSDSDYNSGSSFNVGGYVYDSELKQVYVSDKGVKTNLSKHLEIVKITFAVEQYSMLDKLINFDKTLLNNTFIGNNRKRDNPFWFTKNRKKNSVIFHPLLEFLWTTRGAGSFTAAACQQAYYAALNYNLVELPLPLRINTFAHFLPLWATQNAQNESLYTHIAHSAKAYLKKSAVNHLSTHDNLIIKKYKIHDGIYGEESDLPMREYHTISDPAKFDLNNNYFVKRSPGCDIKTVNGLLSEFKGFHTQTPLKSVTDYTSSMFRICNSSTMIANSAHETEKASLRLIGDAGEYTANRLKQQKFFCTPESMEEISKSKLHTEGELGYHPLAQAYANLFDSDDYSHLVEDFYEAIIEYIEILGIKKEERYRAVESFINCPSEYPNTPDEATFKKWECAKQKWDSLNNVFYTKYGRLFTSLPGIKWIVSNPHWMKTFKDNLCQTIISDGKYMMKIHDGNINIVPFDSVPFMHTAVLYPVHESRVSVDNQHLALQVENCLQFCTSNPGMQASLCHGDDCFLMRFNKGSWTFNSLDISSCDSSHTTPVFGYATSIFKKANIHSDAYMAHYSQSIKIPNPANRKEFIILVPRFGKLGSGCSTTTSLNTIVSSVLCISNALGVMDQVGYTTTNEIANSLPKATFLAHYFYLNSKNRVVCTIDMSVVLRKYGIVKGDIPYLKKLLSLSQAFENFTKANIDGLKNYPPNPILNALRVRHKLLPKEALKAYSPESMQAILVRLSTNGNPFTESDIDLCVQRLLKLKNGQLLVDSVCQAWLKVRYGYPSISLDYYDKLDETINFDIDGCYPLTPSNSGYHLQV